ncbi:MAG: hypothetical protein EB828_06565 [Nitrosopumilus sp. D6]|nr:MAG: hypothetical protein EB828_06565 [Nitrosopumilus sp. D6]
MKKRKTAMMDKQGSAKSDRISNIKRVTVSSIQDLPVLAVTTSVKMEQVASGLNTSAMPILLGSIDGLLYPVERLERKGSGQAQVSI